MDKEHKELHKEIFSCTCLPLSKGSKYCDRCHQVVIEFMDKYGAGVLTNDELIESLEKEINVLKNENESIECKHLTDLKYFHHELKDWYGTEWMKYVKIFEEKITALTGSEVKYGG